MHELEHALGLDSNDFTPGAKKIIFEAARQNGLEPKDIIKKGSYGIPLDTEGRSFSPDSGRFKVEVPGSLDLTRSGVSANDLPAFLTVKGDLKVSLGGFSVFPPGKTLMVEGALILVPSRRISDAERSRIPEELERSEGLSCDEIRVELPGVNLEKKDERILMSLLGVELASGRESEDTYVNRLATMTREEFVDYLINNSEEYGQHADNASFKKGRPNFIYSILTRRPELRGLSDEKMAEATKLTDEEFARYLGSPAKPGVIDKIVIEWRPNLVPNVRFDPGTGFVHWIFRGGKKTGEVRKKAYITLTDPVREITPEIISRVVKAIEATGFDGQFKLADSPAALKERFDNMVIHGNDDVSVDKVLKVVMRELVLSGVQIKSTDKGEDRGDKSHTELLAEKIKAAARAKKRK
jgi:hypothetical protein